MGGFAGLRRFWLWIFFKFCLIVPLRILSGFLLSGVLADGAGVTRQTIIAIEAGKYAPSLPLAFRIARAFGVSIDDVFRYEETDSEPGKGE